MTHSAPSLHTGLQSSRTVDLEPFALVFGAACSARVAIRRGYQREGMYEAETADHRRRFIIDQ